MMGYAGGPWRGDPFIPDRALAVGQPRWRKFYAGPAGSKPLAAFTRLQDGSLFAVGDEFSVNNIGEYKRTPNAADFAEVLSASPLVFSTCQAAIQLPNGKIFVGGQQNPIANVLYILASADGGATWANNPGNIATVVPGSSTFLDFAYNGAVLAAPYANAGAGGNVAISADGGATWSAHFPTLDADVTHICALPSGRLVVCRTASSGIWTSDDNGTTWVHRFAPATTDLNKVRGNLAGTVVAVGNHIGGAGAGIAVSNDGGTTWALNAFVPAVTLTGLCVLKLSQRFLAVGLLKANGLNYGLLSLDRSGAAWKEIALPMSLQGGQLAGLLAHGYSPVVESMGDGQVYVAGGDAVSGAASIFASRDFW